MKKLFKWLAIIILSLLIIGVILFFVGPKPKFDEINNKPFIQPIPLAEINSVIADSEAKIQHIKPGAEAKIIWADSIRKTPYSFVYLHGFSANHNEGKPVHTNIAQQFNSNIYLARLSQHGIDDIDAYKSLTPESMIQTAKEAINIGAQIGEKVIVISTSTGCTASLYLSPNDPRIHAQILLSPNIELYDPNAPLIIGPWGEFLLDQMAGEYITPSGTEEVKEAWNVKYHSRGLIALLSFMEMTMTPATFEAQDKPLFCGYYYKNENEQDKVISVEAIKEFIDIADDDNEDIIDMPFANSTDHVMTHPQKNKYWPEVQSAIGDYLVNELNILPKQN